MKLGLYHNIHAKRKRIGAGSGERMRKPGSKGAPTAEGVQGICKNRKKEKEVIMPYGKGTYGSKVGRPPKKKTTLLRKTKKVKSGYKK